MKIFLSIFFVFTFFLLLSIAPSSVMAEWSGSFNCCEIANPSNCSTAGFTGTTQAECLSNKSAALSTWQDQGYGCSVEQECTEENDAGDGSVCAGGAGTCVPGASCPGGDAPLSDTCPGAIEQVCCPTNSGGGAGSAVINFENPLKYDTVQEVVSALLAALQGIIVLLSIVFIVIGAVMYITSGGNQAMVTLAKGAILASMIGLAIGIAAPSFLKEIYTILAGPEIATCPEDPTGELGLCAPDEVKSATPIRDILMNTLNFLLAIVGVLAMIMLVVGGIMYLLAGGDQNRIDTGKKIVIFSMIGLTVALAALIIVRQIANFFG